MSFRLRILCAAIAVACRLYGRGAGRDLLLVSVGDMTALQ